MFRQSDKEFVGLLRDARLGRCSPELLEAVHTALVSFDVFLRL